MKNYLSVRWLISIFTLIVHASVIAEAALVFGPVPADCYYAFLKLAEHKESGRRIAHGKNAPVEARLTCWDQQGNETARMVIEGSLNEEARSLAYHAIAVADLTGRSSAVDDLVDRPAPLSPAQEGDNKVDIELPVVEQSQIVTSIYGLAISTIINNAWQYKKFALAVEYQGDTQPNITRVLPGNGAMTEADEEIIKEAARSRQAAE